MAVDYTDPAAIIDLFSSWEWQGNVALPSRCRAGSIRSINEITVLVQRRNLLLRLSAAQLEGDPTSVAVGIMQGILVRVG